MQLSIFQHSICIMQKANEAANLGKKWQESILDVCDQHFFFTQVQTSALPALCKSTTLSAVSPSGDVAPRYA